MFSDLYSEKLSDQKMLDFPTLLSHTTAIRFMVGLVVDGVFGYPRLAQCLQIAPENGSLNWTAEAPRASKDCANNETIY